jgi:hypothetical protein
MSDDEGDLRDLAKSKGKKPRNSGVDNSGGMVSNEEDSEEGGGKVKGDQYQNSLDLEEPVSEDEEEGEGEEEESEDGSGEEEESEEEDEENDSNFIDDIRAHALEYYGYFPEEEKKKKEVKASEFRKYVEESGIQLAYNLIINQVISEKKLKPKDFFRFAAGRLKEMGKKFNETKIIQKERMKEFGL